MNISNKLIEIGTNGFDTALGTCVIGLALGWTTVPAGVALGCSATVANYALKYVFDSGIGALNGQGSAAATCTIKEASFQDQLEEKITNIVTILSPELAATAKNLRGILQYFDTKDASEKSSKTRVIARFAFSKLCQHATYAGVAQYILQGGLVASYLKGQAMRLTGKSIRVIATSFLAPAKLLSNSATLVKESIGIVVLLRDEYRTRRTADTAAA
jgi:hypothetical protein